MVVRGECFDMSALDGYVAVDGDEIVGLVTYRIENKECEIMSLDCFREGEGIGTALLGKAIGTARVKNCRLVKLITTNDNIHALRFYQKRGFDMSAFYRNALDNSR